MASKHTVGYFSAYYRGLSCLLELWPKIRKEVPDAQLNVAYGWQSWIGLEGKNDFYYKMEAKFAELADQGVTVHGRLSHGELEQLMKRTKVLAYPTEFNEISMITLMKALLAGCYPVTTGKAAITETQGGFGDTIECANIYDNEYAQAKFVKAVVVALKSDDYDPEPARKWVLDNYSWDKVADKWLETINAGKPEQRPVQA